MIYAPISGGTTSFTVFSHLTFDQAEELIVRMAGVLWICIWGRSVLR
jgi:hypothetical protein